MSWVAHVLGIDDASGAWYLFWSGVGPDIPIMLTAIGVLRKHQCHMARCWRLGRHRVEGSPFVTCARHHPRLPDEPIHPRHLIPWL